MVAVRRIEIIGPGCERCRETARIVRAVVESAGLACEIVQDTSPERIGDAGIHAGPAVVIDGHVAIAGRVPRTDEIRQIIGIG